jgi:DNA repair protein RecO (recombination protein O)
VGQIITDAIVVRAVDYGEADRVVTLITRGAGKVSALARGARRSQKRFGGALALFGAGEATLSPGRGELFRLESLDARRGFPRLATDVARVAHAAYACELTRELLPPHHPEPRAFALLRSLLQHIDDGDAAGPSGPAYLRVFELALLDALGLAPVLATCVVCGDNLAPIVGVAEGDPGERHFDVRRGGVVCAGCGAGQGPGEQPLPDGARRLLLAAQQLPLSAAARLIEDRKSVV